MPVPTFVERMNALSVDEEKYGEMKADERDEKYKSSPRSRAVCKTKPDFLQRELISICVRENARAVFEFTHQMYQTLHLYAKHTPIKSDRMDYRQCACVRACAKPSIADDKRLAG